MIDAGCTDVEEVIAAATIETVTAIEPVGFAVASDAAELSVETVVTASTVDKVGTATTADQVVATAASHHIAPTKRDNDVGTRGSYQAISPAGADQGWLRRSACEGRWRDGGGLGPLVAGINGERIVLRQQDSVGRDELKAHGEGLRHQEPVERIMTP